MSIRISLKHGIGAPPVLADGELAIDESNSNLYIRTYQGIKAHPLDSVALEEYDPNDVSKTYVVSADRVATKQSLSAGGGGQDKDSNTWRVPGLAPKAIGTTSSPMQALMEVTTPIVIRRMRIRPFNGNGTVVITIRRWIEGAPGPVVATENVVLAGGGPYIVDVSLSLRMGRYLVSVTGINADFESYDGYVTWTQTTQKHAVAFAETP